MGFARFTYINLVALRFVALKLAEEGGQLRSDVEGFLAAHEGDSEDLVVQIGPYSIAVAPDEPRMEESHG